MNWFANIKDEPNSLPLEKTNPWAKCVNVDYQKYLTMRKRLMEDYKELPNQDVPQIKVCGKSWTPKELRNEIEAQTSIGKEFVEMIVKEESSKD